VVVLSLTMITWKNVMLQTELNETVKNVRSFVTKFVTTFNVGTLVVYIRYYITSLAAKGRAI
jgi:hypothetical protein